MSFSMEVKSKIWLVLVLSILISSVRTSPVKYDFLWIVHTWPTAACSGPNQPTCSTPVLNRFTIHGLWPRLNSSDTLICPSTPAFDLTKIAGIRTELDEEWPSVVRPGYSISFWRHEWEEHGTCFSGDQKLYFQTGLHLQRSKDIYDGLIGDKVVPGTKIYNRSRIKAALRKKFNNFDAVLRCNDGPNRQRQLVEIVLCYTKSSPHTLRHCPFQGDNCFGNFTWPAPPPPPPPPPPHPSPPPPPRRPSSPPPPRRPSSPPPPRRPSSPPPPRRPSSPPPPRRPSSPPPPRRPGFDFGLDLVDQIMDE